jgi:hypothetical protein
MPLTFQTLWDNHPTTLGDNSPCKNANGDPAHVNQCAIRLGIALAAAGVNLATAGVKCWEKGHTNHTLRVEDLIKWMKAQSAVFGTVTEFKGKTPDNGEAALKAVTGKTGIVAWRNFWGAGNQGDHIDLWDGAQIRKGVTPDYFTASPHILFWEIK